MLNIRTILEIIRAYEGGFTATAAAQELDISMPAAHKYYRKLKAEGFVKGRFRREKFYSGVLSVATKADDREA